MGTVKLELLGQRPPSGGPLRRRALLRRRRDPRGPEDALSPVMNAQVYQKSAEISVH